MNDSKNESFSKKNKFINIFKEGMKKDFIKFDIKVELDESPTDYAFKPFFVKNENSPNNSNKNSKENLQTDLSNINHKK